MVACGTGCSAACAWSCWWTFPHVGCVIWLRQDVGRSCKTPGSHCFLDRVFTCGSSRLLALHVARRALLLVAGSLVFSLIGWVLSCIHSPCVPHVKGWTFVFFHHQFFSPFYLLTQRNITVIVLRNDEWLSMTYSEMFLKTLTTIHNVRHGGKRIINQITIIMVHLFYLQFLILTGGFLIWDVFSSNCLWWCRLSDIVDARKSRCW